jgi:IMP dehydrogenase
MSTIFGGAELRTALTFDDVLMVPKLSPLKSRKEVNLSTKLSRSLTLNNPIISSNMDTVTESDMAIAMARNGGIGFVHRFMPSSEQADMVAKVKRAESFVIDEPWTVSPGARLAELKVLMDENDVGSILVTDDGTPRGMLAGMVTTRDVRFLDFKCARTRSRLVAEVMTPLDALVVAHEGVTMDDARELLHEHRREKLPLVADNGGLRGLISAKDVLSQIARPHKSLDEKGRLLVGAAIGVKSGDVDRALELVEAGVDVLVIDVAHGHSAIAIDMLRETRARVPDTVDIVAGNVATGDGARALIDAGADSIKVGIGGGSLCSTRIVTGCGVPQLSAVWECAEAARLASNGAVPIIADGGIRISGDAAKALAAGASTVMLGSMLAGTDESPGNVIHKHGRKVKVVRGMAGIGANVAKQEREGAAAGSRADDIFDMVPEGVEAVVDYRGGVAPILRNMVGGIASAISYCGGRTIADMQANAEFVQITHAGTIESAPHDVSII